MKRRGEGARQGKKEKKVEKSIFSVFQGAPGNSVIGPLFSLFSTSGLNQTSFPRCSLVIPLLPASLGWRESGGFGVISLGQTKKRRKKKKKRKSKITLQSSHYGNNKITRDWGGTLVGVGVNLPLGVEMQNFTGSCSWTSSSRSWSTTAKDERRGQIEEILNKMKKKKEKIWTLLAGPLSG